MQKKILILFILCSFASNVLAAGSASTDTKSSYDQAVKIVKSAKKK